MVLPGRIELTTSPLPRGCSTTELRQRRGRLMTPKAGRIKGCWENPLLCRAVALSRLGLKHAPPQRSLTLDRAAPHSHLMNKPPPRPVKSAARQARLAEALRANLKRRKA